jgi:hypothetical protein
MILRPSQETYNSLLDSVNQIAGANLTDPQLFSPATWLANEVKNIQYDAERGSMR